MRSRLGFCLYMTLPRCVYHTFALHILAEVLWYVIEGHQFRGMEDLMGFLEERSQQSKTVKLWVAECDTVGAYHGIGK